MGPFIGGSFKTSGRPVGQRVFVSLGEFEDGRVCWNLGTVGRLLRSNDNANVNTAIVISNSLSQN